ncbi:LAQU0S09e00650g1_1 [Lachancea quebecensis]|uniref:LAQU0S09e00650g1_1 n=1 Tax=Lachancea quebecensis TaxID=1654605 RepID=A0A0P1KTV1_9SACH|nr:LAQU0S09e00650g1_1 [Lachancea quebecensis]
MPLESLKKVRFCLENEEQGPSTTEHAIAGQLPVISREELATHTSAEDCWLAIHGSVYDVTRYLTQHPGGAQVMLKLAGKDATAQFDDVGHSLESLMFDLGSGACVGVLKAVPVATALPTSQEQQKVIQRAPEGSSRWEQLWAWIQQAPEAHTGFQNFKRATDELRSRKPSIYKGDAEVRRELNVLAIGIVMGVCIIMLIYVKLRCPSMMEHVVLGALPDEMAGENYDIPSWSL